MGLPHHTSLPIDRVLRRCSISYQAHERKESIYLRPKYGTSAQLLYALASIHDPVENQRLKNDSPPVHMDIRPSSISVTRDGNYLLSVFSPNKFICQPSVEPISAHDYILFHYGPAEDIKENAQQAIYTAPEWFLTGEYTAASDIWSLGHYSTNFVPSSRCS